jgi:hypothetical protein
MFRKKGRNQALALFFFEAALAQFIKWADGS